MLKNSLDFDDLIGLTQFSRSFGGKIHKIELFAWEILYAFLSSADFFFKINFFKLFFQECRQNAKKFRSRSGGTFCRV